MSRRISIALEPTDDEWDGLLKPFLTVGANDPLLSEVRKTLRSTAPEWVTDKRLREQQLSVDRLQQIATAARDKAKLIESLPAGEARDEAHAHALAAAEMADQMISELSETPTGAFDPHAQHAGVG